MNLTFLNGAFLFAALAALLPLLIHLISRRRVATVEFSSLRFLKELERKRIRRVRLRQILLLIIRSLIILFAALALARPTLRGTLGGPGRVRARTSVAIVIDNSASMAREESGESLLARAVRSAHEIAGLLDEGDQAFLVTACDPPRVALPGGTFSPDVLRTGLSELAPGHSATNYGEALARATELLSQARNINRELYVLGDLQRTGWPDRPEVESGGEGAGADAPIQVPTGSEPHVYFVPTDGPTGNLGLSDVGVERRYGGTEGTYFIEAVVANHGRRPVEAQVKLFVDGTQVGQSGVAVENGGAASARFAVSVADSSWHEGRAELPPDAFGADNSRYFVVPPTVRTEVLIVRPASTDERDDAYYLERALDPTGARDRFAVSTVDAGALARQNDGRFPVVVLADVGRLDTSATAWLRRHLDGGGGALIVLGGRTDIRFWNEGSLPEIAGAEIRSPLERAGGVRLAPAVAGHPLLEGLVSGERLLDDVAVRRGFHVVSAGAEDILELPGVGPALFFSSTPRAGDVAVLATGLDPSWNDLTRSGLIVPLVHRVVERLGRSTVVPLAAIVGEDLVVTLRGAVDGPVEVAAPDGTTRTAGLAPGDAARAVVERVAMPGIYRFTRGGRRVALGAVNLDPSESDLAPADRAEIARNMLGRPHSIVEDGEALEEAVLVTRHGRELWRVLVYAAIVLVALEMFLARPRYA